MANKPRSKIYEDVVQVLKTGSFTILQVAEKTKISWETAKNAVETLNRINLLSSHDEGNRTYYTIDEANFLQLNKDTLLGLPLTEKQLETTTGLFKRITELWPKDTSRPLNKTFLQKVLVKLVRQENIINVPYGLYLFGQCAVLYNYEDLSDTKSIKTYDIALNKIIIEYQQIPTTRELLERHYIEEGNELYKTRILISDALLKPFTEQSLQQLKQLLRQLVFSFRATDDNVEIIECVNGFFSAVVRIINGYNVKEVEDLRALLNEVFAALWELMATFNLYQSLLNQKWYDKAILDRYYKLRKEIILTDVENYIFTLMDHCPALNIPRDSPILKFKGILESKPQ